MTTKRLVPVAWVAFLLACSVPLKATEQETMQIQTLPAEQQPLLLNQRSWNDEERYQWYHTSAGTQLMPFAWFMALNDEPFKMGMYKTGVLPDLSKQDDLAVGFAKTTGATIRIPQLGLTCSFCHTTEFTYQGKTFRIDGGPSLQYNARFGQHLMSTMVGVMKNPEKWKAFSTEILQKMNQADTPENQKELRDQVATFMRRFSDRAGRDQSPLFWGPGRFDALGRGGNLIFSQLSPDNLRPANAPASIPALWGAWEYDRVQWGGSIKHPLARNIAQVIGVNANIFTSLLPPFDPHVDQSDPFRSSVDVPKLKVLEDLARKLLPPRWPKEFPPIDHKKATLGRDLYWGVGEQKGLCAHCHEPKAMRDTSGGGKRRLKVTMVSQREIGTDSLYLDNFAARRVDTGPLGMGHLSAKDASKLLTDEIMKRAGVMEDSEYRDIVNEWSDSRQFIARPHVAVWATGPYLHNGSVPTLHELLSPDKRRDCFSMSPNMKYDPENVGFVVSECGQTPAHGDPAGGFDFNTLLPGNSNRGHEFRNTPRCGTDDKEDGVLGCEIKPEHRVAIIEYLKTCDLDLLVVEKDPRPCQDVEQRRRHAATRGTPLP